MGRLGRRGPGGHPGTREGGRHRWAEGRRTAERRQLPLEPGWGKLERTVRGPGVSVRSEMWGQPVAWTTSKSGPEQEGLPAGRRAGS